VHTQHTQTSYTSRNTQLHTHSVNRPSYSLTSVREDEEGGPLEEEEEEEEKEVMRLYSYRLNNGFLAVSLSLL
jgi:hypothetical protein